MSAQDAAQLQQLVSLLSSKVSLPKQTAVVECPKSMVGRVIGKGGETIKALQQYTGAMIQIDQSTDPTRVTIAGAPQSLQLAVAMVNDIVRGTFKGFAMLRQIALSGSAVQHGPPVGGLPAHSHGGPLISGHGAPVGLPGHPASSFAGAPHGLLPPSFAPPQPVYIHGYGFVPPSQAPVTPPLSPLRANEAAAAEHLAALLSSAATPPPGGVPPASQNPQEAQLLGQLLGQLALAQSKAAAPDAAIMAGLRAGQAAPASGPPPPAGAQADAAALANAAALEALLAQQQAAVGYGSGAPRGGSPAELLVAGPAPAQLQALAAQHLGLQPGNEALLLGSGGPAGPSGLGQVGRVGLRGSGGSTPGVCEEEQALWAGGEHWRQGL